MQHFTLEQHSLQLSPMWLGMGLLRSDCGSDYRFEPRIALCESTEMM